eukprot:PhM_4_TR8289/c4_g1_i1/m.92591/K05643/ABCA3; ATP-binding cassette, subfamily A (ABC1), member 3
MIDHSPSTTQPDAETTNNNHNNNNDNNNINSLSHHSAAPNRQPHAVPPSALVDTPDGETTHSHRRFLFFKQLWACLKKSFIIKRRNSCATCTEFLLPFVFVLALIAGWSSSAMDDHAPEIYMGNISSVTPLEDQGLQVALASVCYKPGTERGVFVTECTPGMVTCLPKVGMKHLCLSYEGNATAAMAVNTTSTSLLEMQLMFVALMDQERPVMHTTLDVMLVLHEVARILFGDGQQTIRSNFASIQEPTGLVFAPNSPDTQKVVDYINRTSLYFRHVYMGTFPTQGDAEDFLYSKDGESKAMSVIVIDRFAPATRELSYTLRYNRTRIPQTNLVRQFFMGGLGDKEYTRYWGTGFTTMQRTIHEAFFTELFSLNATDLDRPRTAGTPMPTAEYTDSEFLTIASNLIPLVIVLAFMYPVSQLVKRIVEEKEMRIREGMMIMGLGKAAFYGSWIITYIVFQFFTAVTITLLLDYTIFDQTQGFVVWLMFMLFGISAVMFAFMVSTFFSRSRVAAMVSPLLFCATAIPIFALPEETEASTYQALSILSPSAFALSIRTLANYEKVRGFGMSDFNNSTDELTLSNNVGFLILDSVLYFILGLYFDNVIPTEWGTRESWYFCFLPSYWLGTKKSNTTDDDERAGPSSTDIARGHGLVEETRMPTDPSIRIKRLRKSFTSDGVTKTAVDGLDLDWHPNQVNVLLGHNGAGKTTTINMLTGMLSMTGGDCEVYGKSCASQLRDIRRDIGLCPQHNILWTHLTVREHLDFYAALKGLDSQQRQQSIDYFIHGVDLDEQADMLAGNLSGGQKRKLSVAIAFIGLGRVVLLDEPTAGMDVQARRSTWELIQALTPGRTIILTTHFMDEADILGKNISIMSKGQLHCSGSSLFLKSRLGVGYTLHVGLVEGEADVAQLTTKIKEHIPEATMLSHVSVSASYRLPMGTIGQFPSLFRWLEAEGARSGAESFGINVTTLEEVFIRIAMVDNINEVVEMANNKGSPRASIAEGVEMQETTKKRDEFRPEDHEAVQIYSVWDDPNDLEEANKLMFFRQYHALLLKRVNNARRDRRAQCFQIILPVLFVVLALLLSMIGPPNMPDREIRPEMYKKDQYMVTANCKKDLVSRIRPEYFQQPYTGPTNSSAWSLYLADQLLATHDSRDSDDERHISWNCNDTRLDVTMLFFNASAMHSSPEVLVMFEEAWAAAKLGAPVSIRAYTHPLDFTERQSLFIETIQAFIAAIFVMIPYCFVPAVYTAWLVREKETKAKHLQVVSGMNTYAFWLSNASWDIVAYLITEFLTLMVFAIFQKDEFVGSGEAFIATFLALLLYGLSGIGFAYVMSFFFSSHSTAQNAVTMINFILGFALVITIQILAFIDSTKDVADALRWVFRLVPPYCLGESLIYIATAPTLERLDEADGVLAWDPIGPPLIFMTVEIPIFFCLTLILDSPIWLGRRQAMEHDTNVDGDRLDTSREDVDVAKERRDVQEGREGDQVVVRNLRKVFPTSSGPKVAVRHLTFGIKKAEIFGFLGTNGAGKTTTLSILSGEFPPTEGSGYLCGFDVVNNTVDARRHLGYCPQFDALIDLLTPREHLHLYSALRGVPRSKVAPSVDALIRAACLDEYADQVTKGLSGGNKRKLSLALALIGGPHVVFLDEPSAGMDPVARRSLWGTIQGMAKGRSV